jgi:hypothetical protein
LPFPLSLSWDHVFIVKYPVLFESIPKISCIQNATARDPCNKLRMSKRVVCLQQNVSHPMLWCTEIIPLLPASHLIV